MEANAPAPAHDTSAPVTAMLLDLQELSDSHSVYDPGWHIAAAAASILSLCCTVALLKDGLYCGMLSMSQNATAIPRACYRTDLA